MNSSFSTKIFVAIVIVVIQLQSLCRSAPTVASEQRFPNYLRSTELKINNMCDKEPDHREMCEKCAKVSRNQFVFPLCCANADEVGDWCNKYINYSID